MSCNGCRVLRKGCSESCILRPCLQWIGTPEAQGHATVFVAKFFGRAGLMSFISGVPEDQRPALFQSLLFEACGRTVNPVNGAVGLVGSGNWSVCQAAVETVLRGGTLSPELALLGNQEKMMLDVKTKKRPAETDLLDLSLSRNPPLNNRRDAYSEEESSISSLESGCGGGGYAYTHGATVKKVLNLFV